MSSLVGMSAVDFMQLQNLSQRRGQRDRCPVSPIRDAAKSKIAVGVNTLMLSLMTASLFKNTTTEEASARTLTSADVAVNGFILGKQIKEGVLFENILESIKSTGQFSAILDTVPPKLIKSAKQLFDNNFLQYGGNILIALITSGFNELLGMALQKCFAKSDNEDENNIPHYDMLSCHEREKIDKKIKLAQAGVGLAILIKLGQTIGMHDQLEKVNLYTSAINSGLVLKKYQDGLKNGKDQRLPQDIINICMEGGIAGLSASIATKSVSSISKMLNQPTTYMTSLMATIPSTIMTIAGLVGLEKIIEKCITKNDSEEINIQDTTPLTSNTSTPLMDNRRNIQYMA